MSSPHKKRPNQPHKKGFHVGPRLAKGSYKGHTDKIKKTLIHKAQVKKQYYKDLKEAGYGDSAGPSARGSGGTGANGGALGVRRGQKKVKKVFGEQRRGPVDDDEEEDEENDDGEDAMNEDEEAGSDSDSDDSEEEGANSRKRKSKGKGKAKLPPPRSQPPSLPTSTTSAPPPAKRPRLSEAEMEKLKKEKKVERRQWTQKGSRGQPKLGNRVEMLLGKIKKGL